VLLYRGKLRHESAALLRVSLPERRASSTLARSSLTRSSLARSSLARSSLARSSLAQLHSCSATLVLTLLLVSYSLVEPLSLAH
jgi:hypothetical protein